MKRILLVVAIALVTLSASAVNRPHLEKSKIADKKKVEVASLGAFKSIEAKYANSHSFYSDAKQKSNKVAQIQAIHRAEKVTVDQLIPAYSEWTYYYDSEILGGFVPQIMYDGASFLVDGDKAYFAPFANLGFVEGVLDPTAENIYADYGAVVYTFTSDVIATYDRTIDLSLEPCVVDRTTFTATRSGEKTFIGYYFEETNELYFTTDVCLALFEANSTDTEVFDDYYVSRRLWLTPQEDMNPYISKGTYTGVSYYGSDNNVAGDCEIFVGYEDVYYVKGADGSGVADVWVEYDVDENDPSKATVMGDLYIGTFNFYTDATRTEVEPGIVLTEGLLQSGGNLTAFTTDYSSTYKITDNADGTTTIANTDNTVYGDYVFFADDGGMFNAVDMNIKILWEPLYDDDTAVKNVKAEKVQNTIYNLSGQRVSNNFKGIVIKDGKKVVVK